MKAEKKQLIAQGIAAIIDAAIDFGKTIERHDQAHAEMVSSSEELKDIAAKMNGVLEGTIKLQKGTVH